MSQMKLGTKIALGFTLLIIIALALGGMALWNMNDVSTQSDMLSDEYAPEVAVANNIERYSLLTMFANRGYTYTEEESFLKEAQENLQKVEQYMADAETLAEKSEHLVKLKGQVGEAKKAVAEYKVFTEETVGLNKKLNELRGQMDEAAGSYMKNCNEFLESQNEAMLREFNEGATPTKLAERLTKINLVNDIIDLGNATRVGNFKSQAMRSPDTMTAALKNFGEMVNKFEELRAITRLEVNIRQIENTKTAANSYRTAMEQFLETWLQREDVAKKRNEVGDSVLKASQITSEAGVNQTLTISHEASKALQFSSKIMMIGLAVALIVGILLAIFITRSITGPVRQIIEALSSSAEQVSDASGQVSEASQQLAEGASEQAASIEETSSSLEEMSSMTKQNADNANQANRLMDMTRSTVSKAGASMKQVTQSMKEISTSGKEIGKIIKTIDEIAFQTNLLALNAAVEAARAGEAGQGFAVVADEVRNLAQRAAEAAKNTAELIEGTIVRIDQGNQLVISTDEAFQEVETNSNKVGELVSEISAASQEQAQGIDQINQAVTQMDQVTQTNAANAEESASASEELSAQAESMMSVVGDLVNLVGGAANDHVPSGTRSHGMRVNKSYRTEPKRLPPARKELVDKKRSPGKNGANVAHADDVIPMDDDFSDF